MLGELFKSNTGRSSADFKPYTRLLVALVEDLYVVRDLVAHYEAGGDKPPPGIRGQYAHDRQWLSEHDEGRPFSFDWVCQQLGFDAEAVRESYLSGRAVTLEPRWPA